MTATEVRRSDAPIDARVRRADMTLEVLTVPVSDVDRATDFARLGWRQGVTPPGSGVDELPTSPTTT